MSSFGSEAECASWTPEEIMRNYRGEIKRDIFVRCMEWYTNSEVEAKINANRTDGKKIANPNFYAEVKRNIDHLALRDGHLPTEYRLQFDKRRLANLEARLGSGCATVKCMRQSIKAREAVQAPVLSMYPSPEELEAARPENGKKLQKGRESRDYWYKFVAALAIHGIPAMRSTYKMGAYTFRDEVTKARRIVRRLDEIADIESRGETIPQTFFPSPPVQPGQQLYVLDLPKTPRLRSRGDKTKTKTNANTPANTHNNATPSKPQTTTLLSPRMKSALSFLRAQLLTHPENLPPLESLASRFEHPMHCDDETYPEHNKHSSCETLYTIETWSDWCEELGDSIVERHGNIRIATCLAHIIRAFLAQVWYKEQVGAKALDETFLTYAMGRLENLEGVDGEVEDEEVGYERAAWEAQLEERVEERFLRL